MRLLPASTAFVTVLMAVTGLLVSCSSAEAPQPSTTTGVTVGSAPGTTATGSGSATSVPAVVLLTLPDGVTQNTLPAATAIPNDVDLRSAVTLSSCDPIDGGWSAGGIAANSTDADVTYRITIFFTTNAATSIDSGETDVTVPAGATADWLVEKSFTAPDPTICVLRGVG